MTIVSRSQRLYQRPKQQLFPALDSTGQNHDKFLTTFDTKSLIQEILLEDGYSIETAPIRTGVNPELIFNSNANFLISRSHIDVATTIDPEVRIRQIFFTVDDELFSAVVVNDPMAKAEPMIMGDTRGVTFDNTLLPIAITKDTKTYFEDTPYWMPLLVNESHSSFTLGFEVKGDLSLTRGDLKLDFTLSNFGYNNVPTELSKFLTRLKNSVKVVAYTLDAQFTPVNKYH